MKNIGRREAESDIFHTCSESNIFRFHPKEAIQYLHYYVSESDLNKCVKSEHSQMIQNSCSQSNVVHQLLTVQIQHELRALWSQTTLETIKSEGNHPKCWL